MVTGPKDYPPQPSLYARFTPRAERSHGAFTGRRPSFQALTSRNAGTPMLDLLLLALGLGAFALLAAYAAGCERV
ncbi:hypothetical protein [Muricoccus radiodurans]|uniref:hypothetical protein n=1 Tax=Muricoccus radiodurans TaxID=2231721 RepID=UPI003CF06E66